MKKNNLALFALLVVRDLTTAVSDSGTTREATRIRKALRGDFKESTRTFINTDFVWFPASLDSRIRVNFFTRSGMTGNEKGFRPGIGLFISEKNAPTRVVGGVSFSFDEKGKANLSLTAGYNF
jgi:hypothetical protein